MEDVRLTRMRGSVGGRFAGFQNLMPNRIEDILLVSSLYDSYILEQDGRLPDLLMGHYLELNLSHAPHMQRVSTAEEALKVIERDNFDLIITASRLGDMDPQAFGRTVKSQFPHLPIVFLGYNLREISRKLMTPTPPGIDDAFIWTGDVRILLAIIKQVEDRMNAEHDTLFGEVRVILLVEDSVRFYSAYLPMIYTEVMNQTQMLMEEGVNLSHKLLRMRARPKILLAKTFEEALEYYERFREYMIGVIADARFPREGEMDGEAGLKLLSRVKQDEPGMSFMIQSTEQGLAGRVHDLGASFVDKDSPQLLQKLREFMQSQLGFGDFIFRLPDGREVGRASDLSSMTRSLRRIPVASLLYHASRNHFSNWLRARTEFTLASLIRPVGVSEFDTPDKLREFLIRVFSEHREQIQRGVVTEFSRRHFDAAFDCVLLGGGSLGGKARGLAFFNALLAEYGVQDSFAGVRIDVPPMAVVGTDVFDRFIAENDLSALAMGERSDEDIARAFLSARLPASVHRDLEAFLEHVRYPLAVRSSSLLEDSQYQPFAGIYRTQMLSNNHPDPAVRLDHLCRAIKLVYASTFFKSAKAYLKATGNRVEEEKMAVILQKMVGREREGHAYPSFAGVALSHNFYPVTGMKAEDGVALVALGLGKMVVEEGNVLRFSPRSPQNLPQFASPRDVLANSQRDFYALDMSHPEAPPQIDTDTNILRLGLDVAAKDGSLSHVGSVYSPENEAIYDGTSRAGIPLVTFAPVLKTGIFPLAEIISFLLDMGKKGMGCAVEMEFAADMDGPPEEPKRFHFLQIRPLAAARDVREVDLRAIRREQAVCLTTTALGSGSYEEIRDIVQVRPSTFDPGITVAMAEEVGRFNAALEQRGRPYLLIGPGRWGTADRWLGIPVSWDQISAARVIIETDLEDFKVAPSQGTHFFQNLTAFQIGYLSVSSGDREHFIDWSWFREQETVEQTTHLRHIALDRPLDIRIDGRSGRAAILKP